MRHGLSSLFRGWRIQGRNIQALVLRGMMMRYGRENIGFVWAILEPMILTVGVMFVWSFTVGSKKEGLSLAEFIFTGYMPLTLWRHLTNSGIWVLRGSTSLLYHRSISILDIVFARLGLEFVAASAALVVVWSILSTIGILTDMYRLDLVLLGWVMMGMLASAVGLICAALTEYSETSEKFIQPLQYLILPISGFISLIDWLPDWAQRAMLLNPMVHCFEAFRGGYFGPSVPTTFSVSYWGLWVFMLTFVGLISLRRARLRLHVN